MCTATGRRALTLAALLSVIVVTLAVSPAEAGKQNNRSYTLAERQSLLIERMTNSILLAALGVDTSSLRSIHWSRNRFDVMQKHLREGHPPSGLAATTMPELLAKLDEVDTQWQRYDSIFSDIVKTGSVTKSQIFALTTSHEATVEALSQMVGSYEYFAYGGNHHSILSSTITGTGQLRSRTQLLLRGLMMVAYNDNGVQERQRLAQIMDSFDQTISGLINGSQELNLLPAATPEIRAELLKVDAMWREIQPILASTAAGDAVEKEEIATVARAANDMAVPLTMALIMYLSI